MDQPDLESEGRVGVSLPAISMLCLLPLTWFHDFEGKENQRDWSPWDHMFQDVPDFLNLHKHVCFFVLECFLFFCLLFFFG